MRRSTTAHITPLLTTALLLLLLASSCANTESGSPELDRIRDVKQECYVGDTRYDCCGYVVSENGAWQSPMDSSQECRSVTGAKGVWIDGLCSMECPADFVIVELNPRARDRLLGCVRCGDRPPVGSDPRLD